MGKKILALSMLSALFFDIASATDHSLGYKPEAKALAKSRAFNPNFDIESKLGESSLDACIRKILHGEKVEKEDFYNGTVVRDELGRTLLMRAFEVGGARMAIFVLDFVENVSDLKPWEMFALATWPDNNGKTILRYLLDVGQEELRKIDPGELHCLLVRIFRAAVKGCGGKLDINATFYLGDMTRSYSKDKIDMSESDVGKHEELVKFVTGEDPLTDDYHILYAVRRNFIAAVEELVPLTFLVLKASKYGIDPESEINSLMSAALKIAIEGKNYDMFDLLSHSFRKFLPSDSSLSGKDLREVDRLFKDEVQHQNHQQRQDEALRLVSSSLTLFEADC